VRSHIIYEPLQLIDINETQAAHNSEKLREGSSVRYEAEASSNYFHLMRRRSDYTQRKCVLILM
jgi:hypothetical protein